MLESTFKVGKKKIFDVILEIATDLDLEVTEKSLGKGLIKLEHPGSPLSFGNIIVINIMSKSTNTSAIRVSSRSAAVIQIIDWGTNARWETEIIESVKTNILR